MDLEARVARLEKTVDGYILGKLNAIEETVDHIDTRLENFVGETRANFAEVRASIGRLDVSMSEMRVEMGEMRASIGTLNGEMGEMRTSIGNLNTKIDIILTEMRKR